MLTKTLKQIKGSSTQLFRRHFRPILITEDAPVSRSFGFDRGTPIDRFYIQKFLDSAHKKTVLPKTSLEFGDLQYSNQYYDRSDHWVHTFSPTHNETCPRRKQILSDMRKSATRDVKFDIVIATHVLNFIDDIDSFIENVHLSMNRGASFIGTVASLTPVSEYDCTRWGDFWRFNSDGLRYILSKKFSKVEINLYGNYYAASKFIAGHSLEEVDEAKLLDSDPMFTILLGFNAVKE